MEQKIITERKRKLQPLTYAESQPLVRDLPRDTVLKALTLRLNGSVVTTFASGTPVADDQSTFDNLVSSIRVVVNGSRTVKAIRPHLAHMLQIFGTGIQGERKSSAGASASINPTVDAGFTYGTTGQITSVAETVTVFFEHVLAGNGRLTTWLNLKGAASATLELNTRAFSSLLGFGNTAPVVYSSSTLQFDITLIEAQDVDPRQPFFDFKQTYFERTYSAQVSAQREDINRGNYLSGLMLFTRDGAAGSATTATGKLASNNVLSDIALVVNGQVNIQKTTFYELQADNRSRYGVTAPNASNKSRIDGVAIMDLLANRDLNTALDVRPPKVDNLQLEFATRPSSDVSYTNPVTVGIETHEIVAPN